MSALDILTAIGGERSLARLEGYCRSIWEDWSAKKISDAQAQGLAEAIAARRRHVRGLDAAALRTPAVATAARTRPSCFPPKRKVSPAPDRQASLERRRRLAASGVMPPALAARFTVGELAALRIVADEVRARGACRLTLGEIAARAGVGVTTARRGLREAAGQGLLTLEERRRHRRPNLANVARIVSRDWLAWIARAAKAAVSHAWLCQGAPKGGGRQNARATDNQSFKMKGEPAPDAGGGVFFRPRRAYEATASG